MGKSPSLVFNASRMARMAGGLTSVTGKKKDSNAGLGSNAAKRTLMGSKSGHDLHRPRTPVEYSN